MAHEEWLKVHICQNCHVGLLEPHKEHIDLIKCPICGYTKKLEKEINDLHRITNNEQRKNNS